MSVKGYCQTARLARNRLKAKTIQVECIGSTHGNLQWYESDDRVTRQAASDSQTAGCTLASGTVLT